MANRILGEPLTAPYAAGSATATMHRHGVVIDAPGAHLSVWFDLPALGRPAIVSGDPAANAAFVAEVEATGDGWSVATLPEIVGPALTGRLVLAPVGRDGPIVDLVVGPAAAGDHAPGAVRLAICGPHLPERVLHDVVVRDDAGNPPIAPNAVYDKRSWSDFGLAHVTDTYVARRIDRFRDLLRQAGRGAVRRRARQLERPVPRLRSLRQLPALHRGPRFVLLTGDCYDYIREDDDDPAGGGNAEFLRQLVLGQAPGQDFAEVEPLRVPIFMTPGNHDYRRNAYRLVFDAHLSAGPIGVDLTRMTHSGSLGVRQSDAVALSNRLDPSWLAEITRRSVPRRPGRAQRLSVGRGRDGRDRPRHARGP